MNRIDKCSICGKEPTELGKFWIKTDEDQWVCQECRTEQVMREINLGGLGEGIALINELIRG